MRENDGLHAIYCRIYVNNLDRSCKKVAQNSSVEMECKPPLLKRTLCLRRSCRGEASGGRWRRDVRRRGYFRRSTTALWDLKPCIRHLVLFQLTKGGGLRRCQWNVIDRNGRKRFAADAYLLRRHGIIRRRLLHRKNAEEIQASRTYGSLILQKAWKKKRRKKNLFEDLTARKCTEIVRRLPPRPSGLGRMHAVGLGSLRCYSGKREPPVCASRQRPRRFLGTLRLRGARSGAIQDFLLSYELLLEFLLILNHPCLMS